MDKAWVGVDAGKEFHWAHVVDASGRQLLSRKVENDEADILKLIDEALSWAEEIVWAVDQPGSSAALLLALLWERNQRVLYVPGLTVDRARDAYRGESKTDARDARVIADQARMRSDLSELRAGEQELAELQLLLARRRDLIVDQGRTIAPLRNCFANPLPTLERPSQRLTPKAVAALFEEAPCVLGRHRVERSPHSLHQRLARSSPGTSQGALDLRERLLDGVEVR